jgi:hypothetical protein
MAVQPFLWGKDGKPVTPEEVARQRLVSQNFMEDATSFAPVGHWTQALGRAFNGWASGRLNKIAGKGEEAGLASADEAIAALLAGRGGAGYAAPSFTASSSGAPAPEAAPQGPEYPLGVDALPQSPTTPGGFSMGTPVAAGVDPALAARYAIPEEVKNGIFAGESGGDYNALFGFQNRPGGKFQDTKLTDMTVDQALQFAAPSGEYGQTVKGQIGRVATPMGAYQIVGTTLKAAKDGLGLTGNEVMTPELQDALGGWILANQGTGAWEGYKGPRDGYTPASGGAVTMSTSGTGGGYGGGGTGGVDIASLLALQKNPWVAKKYGGVVDALMGQQFSRQNALWEQQQKMADPMYQAQLAELTAPKVSDYDARAAAAAQYGLQPGTPEYQRFVLAGDVAVPGSADPFAGTKEIGGVLYGPDGQGGFVPLITPPAAGGARPLTDPAERAQWGIPATDTRPYAIEAGKPPQVVGGGGVTVNNDLGGADKFEEAFAKGDAATIETVNNAGLAAQRNLGRIDQLESILSSTPTGMGASLAQTAGEWGVPTEGLSEIQAAEALINSLVPEQRQPGSGPMSDADLALFKKSLPRIINQPGGNQIIIDTMRAIAQYDAEGAAIVQRMRLPPDDPNYLDRSAAFSALQNRPNPLESIKAAGGGGDAPKGNQTSSGVQWSIEP